MYAIRSYYGTLLDISDRIASFAWNLDEAKTLHVSLNKAMITQVEALQEAVARRTDPPPGT